MDALHHPRPAVIRVAIIRPADLDIPGTRFIDISCIIAIEKTVEDTG